MERETLKLIAVAIGVAAVTFVVCYSVFVVGQPPATCDLAGHHYYCEKIGEGIYRCVLR
jgi:hypothetical protein